MDTIINPEILLLLEEFIKIAKEDPKAELECKLLSGKIYTKDVADRILKAIHTLSTGLRCEENRLSISYADSTRVNIMGSENIHKLCSTNSFRNIPLVVEKKLKYFESHKGKKDIIDVPEGNMRFTLRSEEEIRRDWEGNPNDSKTHIRLINRKCFGTPDGLFRIDFSIVKTRGVNSKQTIKDLLKLPHTYELEIEFLQKKTEIPEKMIVEELFKILTILSQSFYQSPFLLKVSDMNKYEQEFKLSKNIFYDLVTLTRRHINPTNPHNISKGYTVTNKADGERSGLYVARDRKLIRIAKNNKIIWTGIIANDDSHIGDFIDGEFIPEKNLFCIFDVYRFRNRDLRQLPLMKNDEDTVKNPLNSRLGCARLFVEDIRTQFMMLPSLTPLRIETKLFLAGDGPSMEEAIRTMLATEFEYEIDGLIFTPKSTPVAPSEDRKGKTWLRVYKWKPSTQNSIDFLLKITADETYDSLLDKRVRRGQLYVSRSQGDDIIYPRETMNGEYIPPSLPADLQKVSETNTRIPSPFQPIVPRDPDAYKILVPLNERGQTVDKENNRVEDNTIVECSFDTLTRRWTIMRTRYDKTYQYRALREPQYGNDISVANNIWTSMHVPITETMITSFMSNPPDESYEDDMYYRDDLKRSSRVFNDVYDFHNRVKEELYKSVITKGSTLLELAVGRGGDLYKWKKTQPSKVVGLDVSLANIISPTQGSATSYLNDRKKHPEDYLPPVLFLQGDMTIHPLFQQEDKYMPILLGKEKATTKYLAEFEGLNKFDNISCQFAIHYACESEETFRAFASNLKDQGKETFFGCCLDGKSVYTLLIGKKTHMFGKDREVCGDFTKEYEDKESWNEEFGMGIKVFLESFDRPALEYLVPFEKITDILKEFNYELVETKMFNELYSQQTNIILNQQQQTFSFLNRTFIFKKSKEPKPETEPSKEEEEEKEPEPSKEEEEKPVLVVKGVRKLKKGGGKEEKPVILFFGEDASAGEHRNFSPDSAHAIIIDDEEYNTLTHYMECMKSMEFDDKETLEKMMKSPTTKAVKALGKKVQTFDSTKWNEKCLSHLSKGLRAKFTKFPELRKQLLETEDKILGYADPRDIILGIGCAMGTPKSLKSSKWRGDNHMGKLLMELRQKLKEESS